jgi:hypothetical protein
VGSAEEASAAAGIPVRLPAAAEGEQSLEIQPAGKAVFNVNLPRLRAILSEIGRSDIQLPDSLDGSTVTVEIPTSVMAQYGQCEYRSEWAREQGYDPDDQTIPRLLQCTSLVQAPSPVITAPEGMNVAQIGEAFLQVMGMSPEEAASFSSNVDWTTTLVIPVPRYGTSYRDVAADGVTGH